MAIDNTTSAGYIDINGKTAGPIQLGSSGAWLLYNKIIPYGEVTPKRYLTISLTNNMIEQGNESYVDSDNLMCLRAKTPLSGTYASGDTYKPYADLNAVATVEWVMAYATLSPGSKELDLNDYVTYDEFNTLNSELSSMQTTIDSHGISISTLNNAITNIENNYATKVELQAIDDKIDEYKDDPFPDGLWLICGSSEIE